MTSLAARLAALPPDERARVMSGLSADDNRALLYTWRFWARSDQLPPPGDWRVWVMRGGRGAGKTRSAAEWVRAEIESGRRREIGIVGPTMDSVRRIQIEGVSGLLATAPPWLRPSFEPANRRVIYPNGGMCWLFSAEEVDRLRGPNLDAAWVDELCSFDDPDALWPVLNMAVRIPGPTGLAPQVVVTTTPRPIQVFKDILADPETVQTIARTRDNAANLDAAALATMIRTYGDTTLGRQELDAEILDDVEGALWSRALIDRSRVKPERAPRWFKRTVVAIDPALSAGPAADETGIVVCAIDDRDECYVLEDLSGRYSPERWARTAADAYLRHLVDRVIAETNAGGDLVETTLRMVEPNVSYRSVRARHGKLLSAEPVVALYEQQRVHHVGVLLALEDQMCEWEPDGLDGVAGPIGRARLRNRRARGSEAVVVWRKAGVAEGDRDLCAVKCSRQLSAQNSDI